MNFSERIFSRLELIPDCIARLEKKIKRLSLSEEDLFDIKLCLQEALVNAVKHGNKFDPSLAVECSVEVSGGRLTIQVRDQGAGFDERAVPSPVHTENLTKTSGRGVYLIKKLMDEVEFFDRGRGVKMTKFFNKETHREPKRREA
jgi:serine/threonine-protein kinase RsbW